MKVYVIGLSNSCSTCKRTMYSEKQDDDEFTTKCVNEECKEFNIPYLVPTLELVKYQPKEIESGKAKQP